MRSAPGSGRRSQPREPVRRSSTSGRRASAVGQLRSGRPREDDARFVDQQAPPAVRHTMAGTRSAGLNRDAVGEARLHGGRCHPGDRPELRRHRRVRRGAGRLVPLSGSRIGVRSAAPTNREPAQATEEMRSQRSVEQHGQAGRQRRGDQQGGDPARGRDADRAGRRDPRPATSGMGATPVSPPRGRATDASALGTAWAARPAPHRVARRPVARHPGARHRPWCSLASSGSRRVLCPRQGASAPGLPLAGPRPGSRAGPCPAASSPRSMSRAMSSANPIPASSACWGYMLVAVKPGRVFISEMYGSPGCTRKSTRARPAPSTAR